MASYAGGGGASIGAPAPVSTVKVPTGPLGLQGSVYHWDDYINRAPDQRLNSIIKKMNSPLRLGLVQQTDDWAVATGQGRPYACRFMFNPPIINMQYNVATTQLPAAQQTSDQLAANAIYPGSTLGSFNLLFDRTYEVAYGPNATNSLDLRKVGVYHDIQAMERVVGVSEAAKYSGGADNKDVYAMGNMLMVPVYILFGGGANNVGLSYVGYFTSMLVEYTLFAQNMVPTRAQVSLQFTQIIGRSLTDLKGGTIVDRAQRGNTTASGSKTSKSSAGGFASDTRR